MSGGIDIDIGQFEFKHRKTKKDKLIKKKAFKKVSQTCKICQEPIYALLDVHRITPGAEGGEYRRKNVVTICTRCHRLEHSGHLKIHGWVYAIPSDVLHVTIDGEEKYL